MHHPHVISRVTAGEELLKGTGELVNADALAVQLAEPFDGVEEVGDPIPSGGAYDAVLGQAEQPLKSPHRLFGIHSEVAVGGVDLGDAGIVGGDAVEADLNLLDVVARVSQAKRSAGIGGLAVAHRGIGNDVDVVPVEAGEDLVGPQALLGKGDGAPLAQTVASGGGAVAVLGEIGLDAAASHHVGIEDVVHNVADRVVDLPTGDEGLVKLGGVGDVEIVALTAVPLGVIAVEGIGDLGIDVGAHGRLGPGGIDLAGGYVLDIVGEIYVDILCVGGGGAQMHHNGAGDKRRSGHW